MFFKGRIVIALGVVNQAKNKHPKKLNTQKDPHNEREKNHKYFVVNNSPTSSFLHP